MDVSRRSLILHTTAAALAAPPVVSGAPEEGIPIQVTGEAGGRVPVVEISVPCARGARRDAAGLAVFSAAGTAVACQLRVSQTWPDGSARWLVGAFEAEAGPGRYLVKQGQPPALPDLLRDGDPLLIDTGQTTLRITRAGASPTGAGVVDLVITARGGKLFRSSLAGDTGRIVVEERGPVRTTVRLEGQCRAEDGEQHFQYIVRWTAWRQRAQVRATVTWLNNMEGDSRQVSDIRLHCATGLAPDRLVFGCERGVYDGPLLKDWPVFLTQEDHNQYWARTQNPDGRLQHLSSGGCDGDRCPGWVSVSNAEAGLGLFVPNFREEYPNEIAIDAGRLSVGLWPERAAAHLASKPHLPANPDGKKPYIKTKYWPVLPHPYIAFFDPESRCLDVKQGVAKTQDVYFYPWTGKAHAGDFERNYWAGSLVPARGFPDPAYVARTGALGPCSPQGGRYATLFQECFGWLDRHIDLMRCYGKFDYGDFKYFNAAPDNMAHPGTKWGHMGEMAREGYWHNNEGDPFFGLLLYHFRTADEKAWARCREVARHLLDVDIRHFPYWGMYTHGYGHCYVETATAGEPDHSWLRGLLAWAGISGDPLVWDWMLKCGDALRAFRPDFTRVDTRTVSVHLHMMCQFHQYTGRAEFLEAARAPADALLRIQNADGSWPAYMAAPDRPKAPGFVDHAIAALADYYVTAGKPEPVRKALDSALQWQFASGDLAVPLVAFGLTMLAWSTEDAGYRTRLAQLLDHLDTAQNRSPDPYGRGQIGWADYGVNNPAGSAGTGRPRQFLGQGRPLTPGFVLAYAQPGAALLSRGGKP